MFGNRSIELCFSTNPAVNERKVYKIGKSELKRNSTKNSTVGSYLSFDASLEDKVSVPNELLN